MDIEKVKEALESNGIDKETIDKVIADLSAEKEGEDKPKEDEPKEDETPAEGKPEEELPPAPTDEPGDEGQPVGDEEVTVPPSEEGAIPPDEVPPLPPEEEGQPAPEVPPEVPPEEIPPEAPAGEPPFDAALKYEELVKENEGLKARITSLEDALASAGILEGKTDEEEVGLGNTVIPGSGSPNAVDDFDDALAILNHKRH